MQALNDYEAAQLGDILDWCAAPPDAASRLLDRATGRAGRTLQWLVPTTVLRAALNRVQGAALRLADERSIRRRAGGATTAELARGPLPRNDALARWVGRRALLTAGVSGALCGSVGGFGLTVDIPTLLVIAFRCIHRTGLCYGEFIGPADRRLALAVFAIASANNMTEKQAALEFIRHDVQVPDIALRGGVEYAARRRLVKESAAIGVNRVARQVSIHLGWRKAAEVLPVTGALIGGAVNGWYLHDIARAAQRAFQLRWLLRRYGEDALNRLE